MRDTLVAHIREVASGVTGVLGTSITVAGILDLVHTAIGIAAGILTVIYMFYMGKKIRLDLKERRERKEK